MGIILEPAVEHPDGAVQGCEEQVQERQFLVDSHEWDYYRVQEEQGHESQNVQGFDHS